MDSTKPIHEQRFEAAVKVIQSLPPNGSFQPSNEMMLKFYSYYKQATQGPCSIPRPGFWDPVGKVKWDAWHALGDMPKDEAMMAYVEDLKLILESMPMTDQVEQLLQILGPFYELVDEGKKIRHVSDLSTGLGSMLTAPSTEVSKSVIRNMQMNGTLDGHLTKNSDKQIEQQDRGGDDDDEDDDSGDDEDENEEEEEVEHIKQVPKKKLLTGKAESLPNGSVCQSEASLPNGVHGTRSALNGTDREEERDRVTQNGAISHVSNHTTDGTEDGLLLHVASDSDSEVYCDSMDQFGVDEEREARVDHSLSESPSTLSSLEESPLTGPGPEIVQEAQDSVQHGGEDGKGGGGGAQRQSLSVGRPGSTMVGRRRGSRSPGPGSGTPGPLQGGGGDGERWGTNGGVGGDLNEQIVMALARLQEDMQSVLERLHTLEALTASQARVAALPSEYLLAPANRPQKKHSWWPFDVSPATVALAVVWPFIAQWLIRLYFQRQRRRTH
ncbi:acyl-CoA-binding domain-containing protein 5A [Brachyhypopomus gauderio]|uniref:acyl-CoA-binding domain-containing protein 5A n=1 Tax=Brachyhypopomus gauderio TaxID=698409 RepID=UPI004042AF25